MITVKCDSCGTSRQVRDEHSGKRAKCQCGNVLIVPMHVDRKPASLRSEPSVSRPDDLVPATVANSRTKSKYRVPIAAAVGLTLTAIGATIGSVMPKSSNLSNDQSPAAATGTFDASDDLFSHPELLQDKSKSASDFAIKGIRIGDPRAKVISVAGEDKGGEVIGTDGNFNFVIRNGRVVTMLVANNEWLKRAGVDTFDSALRNLGKPTAVEHSAIWHQMNDLAISNKTAPPEPDGLERFQYRARHIEITSRALYLTADTPGLIELKEYVSQVEAYVEILKELNAKAEVGLTLAELRHCVQDLATKREIIKNYPRHWEAAESFATLASIAYDSNNYAIRGWGGSFSKSQFADAIKANSLAISAFNIMKNTR